MSFSGRVSRESHEGGLLITFEGRPPRLGARIRISGGRIIGKVDTVLGPISLPLIHIHPLYDGIDARASVGSPVEIAPREKSRHGNSRGRQSSSNFRDRGGFRRGGSGDKGGRNFRGNNGGGRGSGDKGGRNFRGNKGGGRGSNQTRRGSKSEYRGTSSSGRRRDSSKSGKGNRRR